jgi:hypothetical protein
MKKQKHAKNLLSLGALAFTISFAAGCGGHAGTPMNAMNPAAPAPSPTASPGSTTPSNAKVFSDIQKQSGWQSCTACTGSPFAAFSMTQGVASPSQSGASTRFQLLSGTKPFGAALWFKFLGAVDSATHFNYDLYFYMDNPNAPQALEFNVTQSAGGSHYDFSTQCDLVGTRTWRVWDPTKKAWAASSAPCVQPAANTWNHLTWEFERDGSGHVIFSAVTMNGNRSVVNMTMPHTAESGSGVDVAFQIDANQTATPVSVWLDKVSLTYW